MFRTPFFSLTLISSNKLCILATNPEGQLKIIDMALRENGYLYQHPHQRWTVAQIIHCLVQMDPAARDVGKAMAMLDELEREGDELNVDNGEEAEA